MADLQFPKGRPMALLLKDRKKARVSIDEKESAKVRVRSGGQCELLELYRDSVVPYRCTRRAVHVHHMIGGNGSRGRGESAKAIRKQHLCADCHSAVGNKTLVRQGGPLPHWTDRYRRVK